MFRGRKYCNPPPKLYALINNKLCSSVRAVHEGFVVVEFVRAECKRLDHSLLNLNLFRMKQMYSDHFHARTLVHDIVHGYILKTCSERMSVLFANTHSQRGISDASLCLAARLGPPSGARQWLVAELLAI